ncbi:citrate transporter [bacterium]|nr:citrate transporter [bacterium]QQR59644.1 MAG: citrate transporter [Candidatus Melainabacteria bacterium]
MLTLASIKRDHELMIELVPIVVILLFLLMTALMYTRRISALLALPVMAILIAIAGGIPQNEILTDVITKGSLKLHAAYTTTIFGAVLAELMNRYGIAKALVRWVAEFSGDNPYVLGLVLTGVTALLFSTLGGLGAVIMVGSIVLPVMLSIGISSATAGGLFLFGISIGGMFNLANWQLYKDVLSVAQEELIKFVVPFAFLIGMAVLIFLFVELKKARNLIYLIAGTLVSGGALYFLNQNFHPVAQVASPEQAAQLSLELAQSFNYVCILMAVLALYAIKRHFKGGLELPPIAMLTPIVPLILVLSFKWEIIPAFLCAITFGVLATWRKDSINQLTRAIIDGSQTVIPAIVLMIGIGMLIASVSHPKVAGAIAPLVAQVIPTTPIMYVIGFTLMTPLALYRGPLSLWGMGSGLLKVIQNSTQLGGQAIMGMLMSVGQVQGICDPTNTHNIWIATYLGTDTHTLLKKTIPYAWGCAIAGLILSCFFGFVK